MSTTPAPAALPEPHYTPGKLDASAALAACVPESGPLHRYLSWAIKTTDADPLFHIASILPCWAHECCVQGFRIDRANELVPKIWTFTVGAPASSKSTAIRRALGVYRQHVIRAGGLDPLVQAEGSVPGLFEALAERWDPDLGITPGVVYRDEAARLLDTRDSVADMLCNIIDGDEVKRHLRGARAANRENAGSVADTLRNPTYSGLLATTFARLREVTKTTYLEGGLYSRFLWFVGPARPGTQLLTVDPHLDEQAEVVQAWANWARWPLGLGALAEDLTVDVPKVAVDLLEATLFSDLQSGVTAGNDRLNAMRKRALTQAILVAGLYALNHRRLTVEVDDMARAIRLVRLCLSGYERIDPTLAADPIMVSADVAFHAIAGAGDLGLPKSKLYPILRAPKVLIDQALDTLVDEGSVELVPPPEGKRGRPVVRFRARTAERYGATRPADDDQGAHGLTAYVAKLDVLRELRRVGQDTTEAEADIEVFYASLDPLSQAQADLEGWRADPVSFDEAAEEARRQAHNEQVASEVAQGARRSAQEALDAAQAAVTASQGRMPAEGVPGLAGVRWTSAGPRPRPTRRKLHTR